MIKIIIGIIMLVVRSFEYSIGYRGVIHVGILTQYNEWVLLLLLKSNDLPHWEFHSPEDTVKK